MDKKGLLPPEDSDPGRNFMLDLGLQLEPVVARLYERQTGRELLTPQPIMDAHHPELRGTPDRLVMNEARGVELKTENQFTEEFGEPGSDEVPGHYLVQAAHYMMLTGYPYWDIAVLHGGTRFAIYTIKRDQELENLMIGKLTSWWQKHIVEDVPPEMDPSEAWRVYLHQRFPRHVLPIEEIAPNSAWLVDSLGEIRKAEKAIGAYRQEYENRLKEIIGDREGIFCKYGRVTWKNTKDSETVDWEKAFEMLSSITKANESIQTQCIKKSLEIKSGVRRFLYTPAKERDRDYAARAIPEDPRVINISRFIGAIQERDRQSTPEAPAAGTNPENRTDRVSENSETGAS
jgi:predicted phage-related endonuclease